MNNFPVPDNNSVPDPLNTGHSLNAHVSHLPTNYDLSAATDLVACSLCGKPYDAYLLKRALKGVTLVREAQKEEDHWKLTVSMACPGCYDELAGFLPSLLRAVERFTYHKGKHES